MTAAYFAPSAFVPLALGLLSSVPGSIGCEVVFFVCATIATLGNFAAAAAVQSGSFAGLLVGRGISGSVYEAVDMMPLGRASHS